MQHKYLLNTHLYGVDVFKIGADIFCAFVSEIGRARIH